MSDLPTGDASCRVSECGLGSGSAKFNCPRHDQAARDQASTSEVPRELRQKKPNEPPEPEQSTHQPQKKPAKKKQQHSNKLVDAQVQQVLTDTLAPFLEQFKTMSEQIAARAVRPCFTSYIR